MALKKPVWKDTMTCSCELHAKHCCVKEKMIGKTLLEGKLKDGFPDVISFPKEPSVYISVKESWHKRLGHPSSKVLDNNELSMSN